MFAALEVVNNPSSGVGVCGAAAHASPTLPRTFFWFMTCSVVNHPGSVLSNSSLLCSKPWFKRTCMGSVRLHSWFPLTPTCCGGAASNGCPTYSLHHACCPVNNTVTGGLIALAREGGGGDWSHTIGKLLSDQCLSGLHDVSGVSPDEESRSPETLDSVTGRFSIVVLSQSSRNIDNIEGPRQNWDQKCLRDCFGTRFHVFWLNLPPGRLYTVWLGKKEQFLLDRLIKGGST